MEFGQLQLLDQRCASDKLNPLAQLHHGSPQRCTQMGFPRSAGAENQNVDSRLQPLGGLGQLHDGCGVQTGGMGKLKVCPGLCVGQLRFGQGAVDPIVFSPSRFALGQSQEELDVGPMLLGGLLG